MSSLHVNRTPGEELFDHAEVDNTGASRLSQSEGGTTYFVEESQSFYANQATIGSYEVRTESTLGTLTELSSELDDSYSGTILSSSPSFVGSEIHCQPPQHAEVWAISPHPVITAGHNLSMTTIESYYHDLLSINSPNTDDVSEAASFLSLDPSFNHCSNYVQSSTSSATISGMSNNSEQCRAPTTHERAAFVNVANRLRVVAESSTRPEWYSRFTEQDWVEFRCNAEMVLGAFGSQSGQELVLPPLAPRVPSGGEMLSACRTNVREVLPAAFICGICDDLIVGALSMTCACAQSTVCTQCWESYITICEDQSPDGFVVVDDVQRCPFCNLTGRVTTVPCHALDVAILHVVKALPSARTIQDRYYYRLNAWRNEVMRRQSQLPFAERLQRSDQLLAELLQQEEELMWNKKRRFWKTPIVQFFSEVAVAIAAMSIAVGLNVLISRKP